LRDLVESDGRNGKANDWRVSIFLFCLGIIVLVDGFRATTTDPGPIGGVIFSVPFLYRALIKPCSVILVTILGVSLAALVVARNHEFIGDSNFWVILLFVDMVLFLYWEHLFKGQNA
jgi:hypothetical protein